MPEGEGGSRALRIRILISLLRALLIKRRFSDCRWRFSALLEPVIFLVAAKATLAKVCVVTWRATGTKKNEGE